jgi:hypothetical protein
MENGKQEVEMDGGWCGLKIERFCMICIRLKWFSRKVCSKGFIGLRLKFGFNLTIHHNLQSLEAETVTEIKLYETCRGVS